MVRSGSRTCPRRRASGRTPPPTRASTRRHPSPRGPAGRPDRRRTPCKARPTPFASIIRSASLRSSSWNLEVLLQPPHVRGNLSSSIGAASRANSLPIPRASKSSTIGIHGRRVGDSLFFAPGKRQVLRTRRPTGLDGATLTGTGFAVKPHRLCEAIEVCASDSCAPSGLLIGLTSEPLLERRAGEDRIRAG